MDVEAMEGGGQLLASSVVAEALTKLRSAIAEDIMSHLDLTDALYDTETMLVYIEDAERRSSSAAVRLRLDKIKDLANSLSDALDECNAKKKPAPGTLTGMVPCLATVSKNFMERKINRLFKNLREITGRFHRYEGRFNPYELMPLDNQLGSDILDSRETTSVADEGGQIVGRDDDMQCIIDQLLSETESTTLKVLPIYGLGGIGKTTLARLIFNHQHFRDYSRAWVYVSPQFDLIKVALSIIYQLTGDESPMSPDTSLTTVIERLHGITSRNVLLVLDDMWMWEGFPDSLERLKGTVLASVGEVGGNVIVIITTRSEDIARIMCTLQPFRLNFLGDDLCWEIIMQQQVGGFPLTPELEQIGRTIAIKCGGLPLAAQAFGSMLRSLGPKATEEWSEIMDTDTSHIIEGHTNWDMLTSSLKLSLLSMHPRLRSCFAYLAIFPKGHPILKHDLIYQWIAAGIVHKSSRVQSIFDEAVLYIRRLLDVSFLQNLPSDSTSEKDDKNVMLFNTHVMCHYLARATMGTDFINLNGGVGNYPQENKCRYALLTNFEGRTPTLSSILPAQLRALRFEECNGIELSENAFSFAKFLRVLDLRECLVKKLPDSIGQLKMLRYLNAPRIEDLVLPIAITRLSRLRFLSLRGSSKISKLRDSINRLEDLMHLDLSDCSGLETLPESFGDLKCLMHLDLSGCSRLEILPESFGNLKWCLMHLDLSGCSGLETLPESFGNLKYLMHLNLSGCSKLRVLPQSFKSLERLKHLDLSECSCLRGLLDALSALGNLRYLNLSHPCGYSLEDCSHLDGLEGVLCNLIRLRYLNLSMCLNPLCLTLTTDESCKRVAECITGLELLEHLDLSHNVFLSKLPEESLRGLKMLRRLVLTGCFRLTSKPNLPPFCTVDISGCPHLESSENSTHLTSHEEEIQEVEEPHRPSDLPSTSRSVHTMLH